MTLRFGNLFFLIMLVSVGLMGQSKKITTEEYIDTYHKIAIEEMKRSGIPASITLAQGILESGSGNSNLARNGNNHFGIKCHGWEGKKMYQDDDAENECFRVYDNPKHSYRDHSDFLTRYSNYRFLFELKTTDYKGWCRGLKKAGYATSPTYANDLISLIERYHLYEFDKGEGGRRRPSSITPATGNYDHIDISPDDDFEIIVGRRPTMYNNKVEFFEVREGDTYEKLNEEFQLLPWELSRYNSLPRDAELSAGQKLYLAPKKSKAAKGNDYHVVGKGETLYDISQMYAVKLTSLYRKNNLTEGTEVEEGQQIWLRKKKPVE